jgi:hypothetical protein
MCLELWWNDDRGNKKYRAKTPSEFHFFHHKSDIEWLRIDLGIPR